jgi:poly(3-hydroxybutyrate) depolymerase
VDTSWSPARKRVLRRVSQADPAQEYFLYVPSSGGRQAPLFVSVHGVSRNASQHARLFSRYAERHGAVLVAPRFTEEDHRDYQRLGREGRGKRADLALDRILEEVGSLTGASAAQFYLFGHSGGAQFAHRYTMAHPHRIVRAAIASAGWYTFPDPKTRFPYGIRATRRLPGVRFDAEEFLRVPIAVLVGSEDGDATNNLRRTARVDRQQGTTRVERARKWVDAMRAAAADHHLEPLVSFERIPGNSHSFRRFMESGGLGDRVFEALFGLPAAAKAVTRAGGNSDSGSSNARR